MKKVRNHKLICLLMAIAVMISGICLEKIPVNSYFSCKQANTITSSDSSFKKVSVYKAETLNQQEVLSSIQSTKREVRRSSFRDRSRATEFYISYADILPQNIHFKGVAKEDSSFQGMKCSIAILNYIHKQDGEKA